MGKKDPKEEGEEGEEVVPFSDYFLFLFFYFLIISSSFFGLVFGVGGLIVLHRRTVVSCCDESVLT